MQIDLQSQISGEFNTFYFTVMTTYSQPVAVAQLEHSSHLPNFSDAGLITSAVILMVTCFFSGKMQKVIYNVDFFIYLGTVLSSLL